MITLNCVHRLCQCINNSFACMTCMLPFPLEIVFESLETWIKEYNRESNSWAADELKAFLVLAF